MKKLQILGLLILSINYILPASNTEKHTIKFESPNLFEFKCLLVNTNISFELYEAIVNDKDLHHTILNRVEQIVNIIWNIDTLQKFKDDQKIKYKNRMQKSFSTTDNFEEALEYKKKRDYGYNQDESALAFNPILSLKKAQLQKILNCHAHSHQAALSKK
ncbi:MAG: hypothetical protein Q8Q60_05595 [Candidatus Chromulinivorax sp.]|nr:hypothetical protein [Candidatus Chromulinivorax sp.]